VLFRGPRPMWLSGKVRLTDKVLQESLTAYGFPSGHVTGAIVFYGLVFATKVPLSTTGKCAAVTSIATCVGLARMLAMAHLPIDVVGALPLGLVVLPPCIFVTKKYLASPKTKVDPVRPSKRIASANLIVGCSLMLVGLRYLKPGHTRWASKDLTLAIGVAIATGLTHLMLLAQRGLGYYPHHGELSLLPRVTRLAMGLVGQLAGYGVLRIARTRSLVATPWVSEIAAIASIYGCIHSWGAWVVPSLCPAQGPQATDGLKSGLKQIFAMEETLEETLEEKDKKIRELEKALAAARIAQPLDRQGPTPPHTPTPQRSPMGPVPVEPQGGAWVNVPSLDLLPEGGPSLEPSPTLNGVSGPSTP